MYDVLWVHVLQGDEYLSDVERRFTLRQAVLSHDLLEQLSSSRTDRTLRAIPSLMVRIVTRTISQKAAYLSLNNNSWESLIALFL